MKNPIVYYHRADFDGIFSGCIVEKYLEDLEECEEYTAIGYTYGDSIPNLESIIKNHDSVIILDISFPPELMSKLKEYEDYKKLKKFIWIDHHITSIEESKKYGYDKTDGIRDVKVAACEYTWKYFYKEKDIPKIIKYVSAYDIFDKNRFNWDEITLPVQYALRTEYSISEERIFNDLEYLLNLDEDNLNIFIDKGKFILKYLRQSWKSAVKNYSFNITVDNGRLNGIAILSTEFTSLIFESVKDKYDIVCIVNRKEDDLFNLSLYIDPDKYKTLSYKFSAGEYLKEKFNGGGHDQAAGCKLTLEQFKKFIEEKKL